MKTPISMAMENCFDQPLSTKREKSLRGTPTRFKRPPPSIRLTRTAPSVYKSGSIREHIETSARIVSFKPHSERPVLSSLYRSEMDETYLHQCFILQNRLGQGSFGEVVSAKSKDDGKMYAVKCTLNVYRNLADRREKLQEVQRHEMIPAHPNLVNFIKAWEEKGHLYIQVELCTRSLDELARERHEIPEPEIWYYLIDIMMAVNHLHLNELLHVDIKPENIFMAPDGICKLGDFGLVFDEKTDDPKSAVEGDSKYLAREVLQTGPTRAADILSVGFTILELATDLDLPSNGLEWHKIRDRIIEEKYIKYLSPDLRRVIAWMIDPDPESRPKPSELFNDSAICRYKFRRQLLVAKHQILTKIRGKFFWMFSFVTSPFTHLFHILFHQYSPQQKMVTPVIKPAFNSDQLHRLKLSFTETPTQTLSDSEETNDNKSTPIPCNYDYDDFYDKPVSTKSTGGGRKRLLFESSDHSPEFNRDPQRRVPRLDFDQPITANPTVSGNQIL